MNKQISYPDRLYVETTTRCNLTCRMCMKHIAESSIGDADMSFEDFLKLKPLLGRASSIVLNGIGEPLLNPELFEMIEFAQLNMRAGTRIGIQTNGLLLDKIIIDRLFRSGLNELCISLDSMKTLQAATMLHNGSEAQELQNVIQAAVARCKSHSDGARVGIEIVLMQENLPELPEIITWATTIGVHFIIVTHLLPHSEEAAEQSLFNPNNSASQSLFVRWMQKAEAENLDLLEAYKYSRKTGKADRFQPAQKIIESMVSEARESSIWLNLENLFQWYKKAADELLEIFKVAAEIAENANTELFLPPEHVSEDISCRFIEENALFITVDGQLAPCQTMMHNAPVMLTEPAMFKSRTFGSIHEENPLDIWNSTDFQSFRREVTSHVYPSCTGCPVGPCTDIQDSANSFESDCYGNMTPCGACLWGRGGIRCL